MECETFLRYVYFYQYDFYCLCLSLFTPFRGMFSWCEQVWELALGGLEAVRGGEDGEEDRIITSPVPSAKKYHYKISSGSCSCRSWAPSNHLLL